MNDLFFTPVNNGVTRPQRIRKVNRVRFPTFAKTTKYPSRYSYPIPDMGAVAIKIS